MTVVPTRKFCCCLPTRFGVVIVALIGLLGGGLIAVIGGLNSRELAGSKVSLGISIAVYSLLAFVSILGLFGAIGRKLALIKLYFFSLVIHLLFSLAVGIYAIYRIFRDSSSFMKDCLDAHPPSNIDKDPQGLCVEGLKIVKGVTVTLFIVFWLFEIYGCVIVKSYSGQLEDEYAVEGVVKDTESW